jgi:hypothetical protein
MAFVRAEAPDGSRFTIDEGAVETLGSKVLEGVPALDVNDRPLPFEPAPAPAADEVPAKSSTREVLEDYALSHGMTAEQAKSYPNKDQLHDALVQGATDTKEA